MRLRLVQKILESTLEELHVSSYQVDNNNFRISRIQLALRAIKKVENTGILKREIQEVLSSLVFETSLDSLIVDQENYSFVETSLSALRTRSEALSQALQDLIQDDSQDIVSFKLPSAIKLDELTNLLSDLKKALEQAFVNEYIEGEIDFHGFDRGSAWLEISLGSLVAVQILGGMVNLVQDIFDFQQKQKAKELMIKDLDLQVEARKNVISALKKELDLFNDQRIKSLLQEAGIPEDNNELKLRFEYAINTLSQWSERGLEVHPSLTAPPETQKLFPDAVPILEAMKFLPGNASSD